MVDCLKGAGNMAGNRAGDQDASLIARTHLPPDFVEQVNGAGDIGVHYMANLIKVLVKEAMAQAMPGIGQQRIDRTTLGRRVEFVNPCGRSQVSLNGIYLHAVGAKLLGCLFDLRQVGSDQEIEAAFGAQHGQFVADTTRSASHNGELM